MKNMSIQALLALTCFFMMLLNGCCSTKFGAGLNRESSEKCERDPSMCYSDVFVCKGEEVYLCWAASSDVQKVTITDFGNVPLKGCETIIASVDKEYKIDATGGDCDRSITVRINVIEEGEKVEIAASNLERKHLVWNLNYPIGQVSPNIMVTNITPRCWIGCYPETPISNFTFAPCTTNNLLCNGVWSGQKVNINGMGLPTGFQINNSTTFLPPDIPLVGEWFFVPPSILDVNGKITGQAFFTLTAYCK